jgi:hypothetical protein
MEVQSISLRFFLTSRPEHAALLGFRSLQEEDRQYLILHTIPEQIITRDISLFLEHRFSKLREKQPTLPEGWPGKDRLQTLVTIAIPLFIFAAIIALLARPLSVNSLTTLLDKRKSTIKARVESFRSVLSVPENDDIPVRILHLSFRDFLVGPASAFRINKAEMHGNIASHCLRIMSNLRQNICNLPSYGTQRAQISNSVIKEHLLEELQYSCRYRDVAWCKQCGDQGQPGP